MKKITVKIKAEDLKKKLGLRDGEDGAPGRDGKDGIPGRDGLSGKAGLNGADGLDGRDGADGKAGSPDARKAIVEKINSGGKDDPKISASQVEGFDLSFKDRLDRAVSILDQRTQFLINKQGSGGGSWGSITGTLSSQADLQSALSAKLASVITDLTLAGAGTAGSPLGIDLAHANTWTGGQVFNIVSPSGTFGVGTTANERFGAGAGNNAATGDGNTAFGKNALKSVSAGIQNVAIGTALQSVTTGNNNVAVGYAALNVNNGDYNTALGTFSLLNNTTGAQNLAIGYGALQNNTTGSYNTAFGVNASSANNANYTVTMGSASSADKDYNIAIGYGVANSGISSIQIGALGNVSGDYSIGIGQSVTLTGSSSLVIGYGAGAGVAGTALGYNASAPNTGNIAIAASANSSGIASVAIGYGSLSSGTASLALMQGASATANYAFGIGYNNAASAIGALSFGSYGGNATAHSVSWGSDVSNAVAMFLGASDVSGTPPNVTYTATKGSGSNVAGANVTLAGGQSTGSGSGGSFIIATSPAGAGGSALNALVTRITVASDGKTGFFGASAVAQQTGDIATGLSNLGLLLSGTLAIGSVTGLATGIATFLATPSSANLASAVTDETGSGALVFATSPTLVTPNIGNATGTGLTVTAAFTINGTTNATVTMNRAAITNNALFAFQTAAVDEWSLGMRNDSTNNLYIRDAVNSKNVIQAVQGSTPAVTSQASWILNLTKASNLTGNGFVKTSGGDGTLSVDTSTIAEEVAVIDSTGLTANVGATTLYSTGSSGAGRYRVCAYLVTTTAASVSSTMPNAQVVFTDLDSNTSVTLDVSPVLGAAGLGQSGLLTANAVGTVFSGEVVISAKASTTIQYQTVNYASTAGGMAYALHIVLEKL